MSGSHANVYRALMGRELGGRRPGTATGSNRRFYQHICPSSKAQQIDVPEVHICRFSPCGQYLVCFAGGFTQLVVYRFTGPRVSWKGELDDQELASRLASFGCFFTLLYRFSLAPAGEVLARDVVLFMCGGALVLLASHTPYTAAPGPPPPDADPLLSLPYAESINLHLVRLSDGVRLSGSRLECELVDLSGRPGCLGISVHEDIIAVLAIRSQVVHLLQVLRGGEEVVPVRCLGPHVREDDELVLQTAAEAEERWLRARRTERQAGGCRAALAGAPLPPRPAPDNAQPAALPPMRRSINGDLVRDPSPATPHGGAQGAVQRSGSSEPPPPAPGPSPAADVATTATVGSGGTVSGGSVGGPAVAVTEGGPLAHGGIGVGPSGPRPGDEDTADRAGSVVAARLALGLRPAPPPAQVGAPTQAGVLTLAAGVAGPSTAGMPGPQGGTRIQSLAPRAAVVTDAGSGSGPNSAVHLRSSQAVAPSTAPPAAVAVLYPPEHHHHHRQRATAGPNQGANPTPADGAMAAVHQAAVRRQVRQQQYDELAAQGGPRQPPARRNSPSLGPRTLGVGADMGSQPTAAGPGLPAHQGYPDRLVGGAQPPALHMQQQPLAAQPPARPPPATAPPPAGAPPPQSLRAPQHPQQQQPMGVGALAGQGRQPAAVDGGDGAIGFAGTGGVGGGGGFVTGIKQRLLAHLYGNSMRLQANNPRRQQREVLSLFRHFETYRSLLMRKVYLLDRTTLLIDLRTPTGADLGVLGYGGGAAAPPGGHHGMVPSQFFLLFDLHTTLVVSFKASPGDKVIDRYVREASSAAVQPWAESLPLWERFTYDNVLADTRSKLKHRGAGGSGGPILATEHARHTGPAADCAAVAAAAAAERASCSRKLMQLMPPVSGSCGLSSSPYLDTMLYTYDNRVISPYIRVRPCMEQPISFRPRNRPDRAGFRLDPGPYEAMVIRDRRLARNVAHLFHPDAPFLMAVFSVFQQNSLNMNFRI